VKHTPNLDFLHSKGKFELLTILKHTSLSGLNLGGMLEKAFYYVTTNIKQIWKLSIC